MVVRRREAALFLKKASGVSHGGNAKTATARETHAAAVNQIVEDRYLDQPLRISGGGA